jgi:microcompartment protein CcmL/EutN
MRLLVAGVLLSSVGAFAQLALNGPQAAYEGQNVSSVSLIANPHRDLRPLLPLVMQKTGTPYSGAEIQKTAKALKEAGKFELVQVNVEPEVTGLRINFNRKIFCIHAASASGKSSG